MNNPVYPLPVFSSKLGVGSEFDEPTANRNIIRTFIM